MTRIPNLVVVLVFEEKIIVVSVKIVPGVLFISEVREKILSRFHFQVASGSDKECY